jgi:ankyrin repeat protein
MIRELLSRPTQALLQAALHGDVDIIRELLSRRELVAQAAEDAIRETLSEMDVNSDGALLLGDLLDAMCMDVNGADPDGITPLMVCMDVNGADPDGFTPLIGAAVFGHTAVVRLLVGVQGVELDKDSVQGHTALLMAAERGHAGVVKVLVGAGCDVNKATTPEQCTPLYAAAGRGRLDVIELLLRAGCDVNKTCSDGSTPLYVAKEQGHEAVCRRLLRVPGIEDRTNHWVLTELQAAMKDFLLGASVAAAAMWCTAAWRA